MYPAGMATTREARPELPPLTALRTFEAAARHLSFTRAARELAVTQTAVSHQIKQLESHLGTTLFRRLPRRLALTRDGAAWAEELSEIFARLEEVHRRLGKHARRARPVLSVSVIPSFAARWLVPRLGRFLELCPDLDVHLSPTEHLVDFAVERIDVGIRYGRGRYAGLSVDKLLDDAYVVVCAPALRSKRKLATPADLARHVLLHDDAHDAWTTWLAEHGASGVDGERGPVLTDSSMLVEAAVRGQGVALARRSLVVDDLATGRLVLAFPDVAPKPAGLAYYLVGPAENMQRKAVVAFRAWLKDEIAALAL